MLRPKQLFPLYKGTRAWLAAGTSSGSKNSSLDGGNGSGSQHSDDQNCEDKRRKCTDQTISQEPVKSVYAVENNGYSSRQGSKSAVVQLFSKAQTVCAGRADGLSYFKLPFTSSRNASVGSIPVSENSGPALPAPQNPHKDATSRTEVEHDGMPAVVMAGISAATKLSDYIGFGSSLFMVQHVGISPTPTLYRKKQRSTLIAKAFSSVLSEKSGMDEAENSGIDDPEKSGTTLGCRRVGANSYSGSTTATKPQEPSTSRQPSQLKAGLRNSVNELNDRMGGLRISSQTAGSLQICQKRGQRGSSIKEFSSETSPLNHHNVTFEGAMGMQGQSISVNAVGDVRDHSQSSTQGPINLLGIKATPGPCRRTNCMKQSRGVRRSQIAEHTGHNAWKEVVEQVCKILRQSKWGPGTEDALAKLETRLSAYHINEVLKQQVDVDLALNFFDWARKQNGFKHDNHTYTTMVGILGRAKRFNAINVLLEDMDRNGCLPNVVTFNRLIHCYGRAHYMGEALRLFYHMQEIGCMPDKVTYCTLIDLHAKAGYLDVAMGMYRKMKLAGLQPDTFTYSVMINCLGKAGDLSAAYRLFGEMSEKGCTPNLVTYNIIMSLHAKAGKYQVTSKLYNDMQDAGFSPDQVTYSIMMEVLGNLGRLEEAEQLFSNMQEAGWIPDMPVYGLLVDLWGKSGNITRANEWYMRMIDTGLTPNVPTCNSLLGAFLRASLYDECIQVLQDMLQWGLTPTLQTYTLLLSYFTSSEKQKDCDVLWNLMIKTGHSAHSFLCGLPSIELDVKQVRNYVASFYDHINCEDQESKRGFTDAVIDYLHKSNQKAEAGIVWEIATERKLYPNAVIQKAPRYWCINLHVMSMGTAVVAVSRTLAYFREQMLRTGLVPERIDIITGWGRRSRVTGSSLLKQAVESILNFADSPFQVDSRNLGCLVGSGKPLMDWLQHPEVEQMHLL